MKNIPRTVRERGEREIQKEESKPRFSLKKYPEVRAQATREKKRGSSPQGLQFPTSRGENSLSNQILLLFRGDLGPGGGARRENKKMTGDHQKRKLKR